MWFVLFCVYLVVGCCGFFVGVFGVLKLNVFFVVIWLKCLWFDDFFVLCVLWNVRFVLVGIRWLMIMFFFRLCRLLCLFMIVVLVSMWVVFWNDVVEMNELVDSDVFVILSSMLLYEVGCLFLVIMWLFLFSMLECLICLFGMKCVLLLLVICIWCSIWWMIILMCLLLIFMFCRWYMFCILLMM